MKYHPVGVAANGVKFAKRTVNKKVEDVKRFFSYDKWEDKEEEEEVDVCETKEWDEEVEEPRKEKSFWGGLWSWVVKMVKVLRHFVKKVWKKVKRVITKAERALRAKQRLDMWRGTDAGGLNYGNTRDLMIDGGVISMFRSGQIQNTALTAIPLIERLTKLGIFAKAPGVKGANAIHTLMWNYFRWTGDVSGYDWQYAKDNPLS